MITKKTKAVEQNAARRELFEALVACQVSENRRFALLLAQENQRCAQENERRCADALSRLLACVPVGRKMDQ